jgi:hypothetical protein
MSNQHYLITLVRANYSRDVYVPSLERPENKGIMKSSEFASGELPKLLKPNRFDVDFVSKPDAYGLIGIKCDVASAETIQKQTSKVASVLNIHKHCTTDPWDLLPMFEDDNTRRAFAELRNERRLQKDIESHWATLNRAKLRELCADLVKSVNGELAHFELQAIGNYLGLSTSELSQYMIISPERLHFPFPAQGTPDNVVNRARSLVLIAYHLRKIFERHDRATNWMLRNQPEGWHHNGMSAKDCLLNGLYTQVFSHLTEITRPELPLCGGTHRCSHDFYCASKRC